MSHHRPAAVYDEVQLSASSCHQAWSMLSLAVPSDTTCVLPLELALWLHPLLLEVLCMGSNFPEARSDQSWSPTRTP